MQSTVRYVVVCLLVVILTSGIAIAQQQPTLRRPVQFEDPLTARSIQMTPLQLSQRFEDLLKAQGIAGQQVSEATAKFKALPNDLQDNLILTLDTDYARIRGGETLAISRINPEILERIRLARLVLISSIWPSEGAAGGWAYAFGKNFDSNCVVHFNGSPVQSHYLGMNIEFFPNSMAFKIPSNATRGQEHDVLVHSNTTNTDTAVVKYMVIAPRGYRGHNGWQFSNFSRATIDWQL
ncbi:MAG: hypothetical protein ACOX9R_16805, partial [Armatimonadota bacterium]